MGCKASKEAAIEPPNDGDEFDVTPSGTKTDGNGENESNVDSQMTVGATNKRMPTPTDQNAVVYKLLLQAQRHEHSQWEDLPSKVAAACEANPDTARYQNPHTQSTPLHMAVRLLEDPESALHLDLVAIIEHLLKAFPEATSVKDVSGNLPLHYAIAPAPIIDLLLSPQAALASQKGKDGGDSNNDKTNSAAEAWAPRAAVLQLLLTTDMELSLDYLTRNNVLFDTAGTKGVSPLYQAIQGLPDDFESYSYTYEFIAILRDACGEMIGVGNSWDGDKPLALLYRRFTRQFDLAEKYFEGDNSRPEVVHHRWRYKTAAANTWKIIECLLRPEQSVLATSRSMERSEITGSASMTGPGGVQEPSSPTVREWRLVHRAVQVETPPDLLRYIVETNAEDLTQADHEGNLPLHYAAKAKGPRIGSGEDDDASHQQKGTALPAFYTKYVVDELLYKFPEAASRKDAEGKYPLTLAVEAGKQWIGGGIKSLYDAFPAALKQINLEQHETLRNVLAEDDNLGKEEKEEKNDSVIRDEHHDAIMLVQQDDVDVSEIVTSMWAHEEDAGVQMLSCVALSKLINKQVGNTASASADLLRIALSAVAALVNAMKAHPNEVIVQEKACHALALLAPTDGLSEISFVASGAVAAIVGAMQAHVSDPTVQEEACRALSRIVVAGGAERATIVASVSGLTAIVNALAAHSKVGAVQLQACEALQVLTSVKNANLPQLPRMQTEPLLQSAISHFPECATAGNAVLERLV